MKSLADFHQTVLNHLHDGVYVINPDREIVYWNQAAEKITGYQKSEMINCCCYNDLLNPIDENGIDLCRSGCPAEKTLADGIIRTEEAYLHHKNGYRIPVEIKLTPVFGEDDEKVIGVTKIISDITDKLALSDKLNRLKTESLLDTLTGIGNRKYIKQKLKEKLKELKRYNRQFGVLFIDLDNFKEINDTYGHRTGDKVLKMAAHTIEKNLRAFDIVGRWGGDEFVAGIISVSEAELKATARRLKNLINNSYLTIEHQKISITASIGGTTADPETTVIELINQADKNMYHSKAQKKNAVTIE